MWVYIYILLIYMNMYERRFAVCVYIDNSVCVYIYTHIVLVMELHHGFYRVCVCHASKSISNIYSE